MRIFKDLKDIKNIDETAVALGNFDGIHKGHRALIQTCLQKAEQRGLASAVFTFTNHPANVIAQRPVVKNILTFDEKARILEAMGVDYMFSVDFTDYIRTSPEDCFCRYLLYELLRMREAVCGFNYRFGFKAAGTPETLTALGKELGYGVTVMEPVTIAGSVVSSTLIRAAISNGDMEAYKLYTDRLYSIGGKVIEGKHLGRRMGFPTVNLALDDSMALPKNGVYVTRTYVNSREYNSITNVGNKPTVGQFDKNAETHIFDFDEELYGRLVDVEFIKLVREERTFPDTEALAVQIKHDCIEAKNYHDRNA